MKIILLNLPTSIYVNKTAFIPLPLLILGSCLKEIKNNGIDFSYEVIDLDLMFKQGLFKDDESFYQDAGDLLIEKRPDVLMFTVHGINHVVALRLSEQMKKAHPQCVIIAGGVGPTLQAHHALKQCHQIDIIVKGEGEPVLKHLIPALADKGDLSSVPSIVFRKNGHVMETPRRNRGHDEPITAPDYSLVRIEDYVDHNKKNPYIHPGFSLIESGRGCPFRCSFCAPAKMWESNVRYRPIPEIIHEMQFLAEQGGDFSFFTQDNLEEGFLKDLSGELIHRKVNIPWGCYSRLDQLSEDMGELLSKAGCRLIFTGFETPSRNLQKSIRKVIDADATFEKLQRFNTYGIRFIGSFIAGFTDETDEELEDTLHFALQCASGKTPDALRSFIEQTDHDQLPQKAVNSCLVHPLAYMPGTDTFEKERERIRMVRYSIHPDCYGSYIFSFEQMKDDWSFLGINPYLHQFPEEKVRYYSSTLRIFNLLNSRPFYFALLLSTLGKSPLGLTQRIIQDLDEEFVLTAKIKEFEAKVGAFAKHHLDFVPEWTVKKGH